MRKIFFVLILALTVSVANAWEKRPDHGVFLLATKHMSAEAKNLVNSYFGADSEDDMRYLNTLEQKKQAKHTREIHYLHLDGYLKPAKVEGDDALMAIEQSLAIVRNRDSYAKNEVTKALRTIVNLMCDMHNLSYVRIEGIPHSQKDFSFQCYNGDYGKRKTVSPLKWSRFWTFYVYWHGGFSGELWAEDLELSFGDKFEEFSAGSLHDWARQVGATAYKLYARINPEYVMTRRERNELEDLNCEMMARAGFRLAALLNEAI